jgi:16S rRNA G966 N2-methylase RsmD
VTPLNVFVSFKRNYERISRALKATNSVNSNSVVTNHSATSLDIISESVDYIFVDPPFGSNLMYSELNFLWEPWLRIVTNNAKEAVINKSQQKGLFEYQQLMEDSFRALQIALKPGRWMTVEFHNSQNSGGWSSFSPNKH